MRPSENFNTGESVIKGAEPLSLHHLVSTNVTATDTHINSKGESAALVKGGVLPHVDFQDDKHPKKKDTGHGTTHSGGHGPDLKNVHVSKQQGELIKGVVKTVVPGGGLLVIAEPFAEKGIKNLVHKIKHNSDKKHSDKNHSDKSHTDKSHTDKSHPDDPLHKFKEEGKKGPLHQVMKKFHLTKS